FEGVREIRLVARRQVAAPAEVGPAAEQHVPAWRADGGDVGAPAVGVAHRAAGAHEHVGVRRAGGRVAGGGAGEGGLVVGGEGSGGEGAGGRGVEAGERSRETRKGRSQSPAPPYSGERGWGEGVCLASVAAPLIPNPSPPKRGRGEPKVPATDCNSLPSPPV